MVRPKNIFIFLWIYIKILAYLLVYHCILYFKLAISCFANTLPSQSLWFTILWFHSCTPCHLIWPTKHNFWQYIMKIQRGILDSWSFRIAAPTITWEKFANLALHHDVQLSTNHLVHPYRPSKISSYQLQPYNEINEKLFSTSKRTLSSNTNNAHNCQPFSSLWNFLQSK